MGDKVYLFNKETGQMYIKRSRPEFSIVAFVIKLMIILWLLAMGAHVASFIFQSLVG